MVKKFYAVKEGRVPGIYETWDKCKAQVDGYSSAVFKGFATKEEAEAFIGVVRKNKPSAHKAIRSSVSAQKQKDYDVDRVIVYTDGSCLKNPGGPGGYAAIIRVGQLVREISGSEPATTNNRMEMMAAITALQFFEKPTSIVIYTDSQYLRRGLASGWVENWKRNGWITKNGTPVLNKDLWIELDRLNSFHRVVWNWVKGHNGNPLNERCDELAVDAAIKEADKIGWKYSKRQ